eukprot:12926798-Prorocentrum_lima.AAC.1
MDTFVAGAALSGADVQCARLAGGDMSIRPSFAVAAGIRHTLPPVAFIDGGFDAGGGGGGG